MPEEMMKEVVAIGNLKSVAEQPAMYSNLAYSNVVSTNNLGKQNAVANQQAGNQLAVSMVAKGTNTISNLGPMEARSAVDILTNNELAQTIADLKAAVEAFTKQGGGGGGKKRVRVDPRNGDIIVMDHEGGTVTLVIEGEFTGEDVTATRDEHKIVVNVSPQK